MGCLQPKSPIQTDNSTAAGVDNKTIVPCWVKMMDMEFKKLVDLLPNVVIHTMAA